MLIIIALASLYFGFSLIEKVYKEEETEEAMKEGYEIYFS